MTIRSKCVFFLFLSFSASAQVELAPIVKTGSAADALEADPIVPSVSSHTEKNSGDGSIVHSVEYAIPLSAADTGTPGNLSQIRGAGSTSDDVDVEAFGVTLNNAQGGGFNFSEFPQYLWSSFDYQTGPSLSAFDLRAVSGTLRLNPWSEGALQEQGTSAGASNFYSTLDLDQVSASYQVSHQMALIAGYSFGVVRGPGLGFSYEWKGYRFHLLAARQDADSPGSLSFPTPGTKFVTDRVIPVIEKEFSLSQDLQLKSTLFYDGQRQQYEYPGQDSNAKIQQAGIQNALLWQDWTLGLSTRATTYQDLTFQAPVEEVTNLQLSRLLEWDRFTLSPTFQGVWISRLGLNPEGSLGARYQIDRPLSVYSRATYSEKFPTLVDRYSTAFQSIPNPGLEPEKDYTAVAGVEMKNRASLLSLEQLAQKRNDAQVSLQLGPNFTKTNAGSAYVFSTVGRGVFDLASLLPGLEFSQTGSYNRSQLSQTGQDFPYLRTWNGTSVLSMQSSGLWKPRFSLLSRYGTSAVYVLSSAGDRVPSYALFDLGVQATPFQGVAEGIHLEAKIENLMDRPVQLVEDYPLPGRTFSFLVSGNF